MEKRLRIATVLPPITMSSSALAFRKSFSFDSARERNIWVPKQHELEIFIYTGRKTEWMEPWQVYTISDGIFWLLHLFFDLVRGKFNLFTSTTGPEGLVTFVTSKLLRRPLLLGESNWFWSDSLLSHFYWPFARFVACHATAITVVSARVLAFWKKAGVPSNTMRIVHAYASRVEPTRKHYLLADELRRKFGNKKIVLYFGRLIERKGISYLIKAFAKIEEENENVVLIVAGAGPEEPNLKKLCDLLKLNDVIFTGFVQETDKPAFLLCSDVLVYPSITIDIPEEWGLAVNEAMSVGKPVIVTKTVGCAYELVKPGVNGYVVPERDVLELYRAIREIVTDDELRTRMGKAAKKTVEEQFTYDIMDMKLSERVTQMFGKR